MNLTDEEIHKRVEDLALPFLADAGVDLIELHIGQHKGDVFIQFTADKTQGRITIAECAHLNRTIVEEIDRQGFLGENYSLEFSSPGLDRPLKTAKDFQRHLDVKIHFWLNTAVEGKKEWTGILTSASPEGLDVLIKKNHHLTIPLAYVIKGVQVI